MENGKEKRRLVKKGRSWYQLYKENNYLTSINENFIDDLSEKLLNFAFTAKGNESIVVFLHELGVSHGCFNKWMTKHESLKEAYEQAKKLLAARRLAGGLERKFDPQTSYKSLHTLDELYKEDAAPPTEHKKFIILSPITAGEKVVAITGDTDDGDGIELGQVLEHINGNQERDTD